MKKKIITSLIKISISIFLLSLLFEYLNLSSLFNKIKDINIIWLIIPMVVFYLGLYVSVCKWSQILNKFNIAANKINLYYLYMVGSFYNNFLPSSIGGDGFKIIDLSKRYTDKKNEIFSSIILERGFGFLVLYLFNFVASIFFIDKLIINKSLIMIESLVLLSFSCIVILYLVRYKITKLTYLKKFKLLNSILRMITNFDFIFRDKFLFFKSIFLSSIFFILGCFSIWAIYYSLGVNIDFCTIIFINSIIQIFSIIPISLNNIGVTESLFVFLFSIFMIDPSISFLVSIVGRTLLIFQSSTGGLIYLLKSFHIILDLKNKSK